MKSLRKLYYDYYETYWYTLGLMACALISYFLSRYLPVDLFEQTLSPVLHVCVLVVAAVGAILLQRHIFGIRARRVWQIVLIVYPLLLSAWLFHVVHTYRMHWEENFSSLENTGIVWMRNYLMTLVICGLSYFYLCFSSHPTRVFTQQLLVLYLLTANTAQILLRSKPWQEETEEDDKVEDPVQKRYREELEAWMEKDKPYLNPNFRLTDLMQVLPMNRTYLSNFINGEYGCNFYQYATNYRIREAKRLIREHPDMKLMEVAELSGFSSAITFSRTFAREEGCSPSEWAKLNEPTLGDS